MEDNIVWTSVLDGVYLCEVVRATERDGLLTVKNTETGKITLVQEVGFSYGAIFGPDVDDVSYWQDLCVEAVDGEQNA